MIEPLPIDEEDLEEVKDKEWVKKFFNQHQ
jgi:hypothetical protein